MYTVELVDKVDGISICNDFEFETITEAYAFLWQCRESWIDPDFDLSLYKDDILYVFYDDYVVNS